MVEKTDKDIKKYKILFRVKKPARFRDLPVTHRLVFIIIIVLFIILGMNYVLLTAPMLDYIWFVFVQHASWFIFSSWFIPLVLGFIFGYFVTEKNALYYITFKGQRRKWTITSFKESPDLIVIWTLFNKTPYVASTDIVQIHRGILFTTIFITEPVYEVEAEDYDVIYLESRGLKTSTTFYYHKKIAFLEAEVARLQNVIAQTEAGKKIPLAAIQTTLGKLTAGEEGT